MKNFTWLEGGPLKIPNADLYVIPYYSSNKSDPSIKVVMEGLDSSKKAEMISKRTLGQIIKIPNGPHSQIYLLCLSENKSNYVINSAFKHLLSQLEKEIFKHIVFGLMALIEYGCQDEEGWKKMQTEVLQSYAKNHPDRGSLSNYRVCISRGAYDVLFPLQCYLHPLLGLLTKGI